MHYHCEIVMPPTKDIAGDVAQIMGPFDENGENEDGGRNQHPFWDFYVIGGRWAGAKYMAQFDEAKLTEFNAWLKIEKVTVSGFTAGKQTLSPDSQRVKVDDKWNQMFPSEKFTPCPMFSHSNDQYARAGAMSGAMDGDVTLLGNLPAGFKCDRVIIAGPSYDDKKPEATFMLSESAWNGVNHMKVDWDGAVASAVGQFAKQAASYREDYCGKVTPSVRWLVVTVDYHS